ncbi:hypothetical protein SAMN03159488_01470 [Pseudomonas sp. NFIX10]|nr:hypothetical protein SAMN03159488_01470 [Pseudomonas sp. NFIX10]SFE55980.1 hypothetical protein SAMN03159367_01470 [Pseudomonas sp. NFACC06-1]
MWCFCKTLSKRIHFVRLRSAASHTKQYPPISLKPLALNCRECLKHAGLSGKYERFTAAVQNYIDTSGPLHAKTGLHLDSLAHYYDAASCDAFIRGDRQMLSHALQQAILEAKEPTH